jgi:F-type H+-transporting ATPase subunit a
VRKFFTPRNIILIIVVLVAMIGSAVLLKVPLPTIVLPAEKVFEVAGIEVTNTFFATLIADTILIVLAILTRRKLKDVPSGLQNLMEWFVEAFHNLSVDVAGKANAAKFFPLFMTILMFVLVANWMGLIPCADSIGKLEPLEYAYEIAGVKTGYIVAELPLGIRTLTAEKVTLTEAQIAEIEAHPTEAEEGAEEEHHDSKVGAYVLAPYVRGATTDLNVPLALALISVFWTQVVGFRALGVGYLRKFAMPPMTGIKPIDLFIGILEFISEIAKIISFTFRLFGNVFAGMVLLFVMTFLVPFIVPLPFYGLEVFVGFMQAFVFAFLTLIFMSMAVVSHTHDEHH